MFSFVSLMIGFFVILPLVIVVSASTLGAPTSGQHTGIITAVETTGLVWPTHTVYVKTDSSTTQEESYCVTDERLLGDLRRFSSTRQTVTVLYHRENIFLGPWDCAGETAVVWAVLE